MKSDIKYDPKERMDSVRKKIILPKEARRCPRKADREEEEEDLLGGRGRRNS
jgi:hypothetical protein